MASSTQVIEITGGLVTAYTKSVEIQGKTEDILPKLITKLPITISPIPKSAVAIHWNEEDAHNGVMGILCEISPGMRTIRKNGRMYRVAMPWTYFWFSLGKNGPYWSLSDYRCFHAKEQYSGIDTPMQVAFLPNLYRETGAICFGDTGAPAGLTFDKQVDYLVNNWYNTTFNGDLDRETQYPFGGISYKAWVDASKGNAFAWQDFPEWGKGRIFTVRDLLTELGVHTRPLQVNADASAIPEIRTPFTFGRAEEWLKDALGSRDRWMLSEALKNLYDAGEVSAYIPDVPDNIVEIEEDDGGVPYNDFA